MLKKYKKRFISLIRILKILWKLFKEINDLLGID